MAPQEADTRLTALQPALPTRRVWAAALEKSLGALAVIALVAGCANPDGLHAAESLPATSASDFDSTPVWPLCGRIAVEPPAGWKPADGCPAERFGNPAFTDAPLSSTFGPRLKASNDYRYDFHRGIDIPAPTGTPVFAIANGVVDKAGNDPAYSDAMVQVRHFRPGHAGTCETGGGCYLSNYLHLSDWVVKSGDAVDKGELLGFTGASESGFEHLHFEIRNGTARVPSGAWQRHAIHPLAVLAHPESRADNLSVAIEAVDRTEPSNPRITASVSVANSAELDLNRIEVELLRRTADGSWQRIEQRGENTVSSTPEGGGYHVNPPWFDMNRWNHDYSHQDSGAIDWASFGAQGAHECPFHADHPASYDANAHLDRQANEDPHVGQFNGVAIEPAPFNATSTHYALTLTFLELGAPDDADQLCTRVRAIDARGNATSWVEHNCS